MEIDALFVFSPITETDTEDAARKLGEEIGDARAQVLWDPDKTVATALAGVLDVGASQIAWDVYLWFDAAASWENGPPVPAAWAHQLSGADAEHGHPGGLAAVFDAWMAQHLTGRPIAVKPRDAAARETISFGQDQIKPLPEALLEMVLADWVASEDTQLDGAARRGIADDLLVRLRDVRSEYASRVPKAVILDGRIYTLPDRAPSCAPDAPESTPEQR